MSPRDLANRATVPEAAEIIGCSVLSLRTAVGRGAIPTFGVAPGSGRPRIVDLTDVEAWRDAIKQRQCYIETSGTRSDEEIARARGVKVRSVRRARQRAAAKAAERRRG